MNEYDVIIVVNPKKAVMIGKLMAAADMLDRDSMLMPEVVQVHIKTKSKVDDVYFDRLRAYLIEQIEAEGGKVLSITFNQ